MANLSSTVPAAILGSLAGVMLIFIWWWFPRTWKRGVAQDNAEIDDIQVQAEREMVVQNARRTIDNYREVLKQRELAKNAGAQSIASYTTDIETQHSTTNPIPDVGVKPDSTHTHVDPVTIT
ncbi:hypothetical protein LTR99_001697 [Exophiala xenobiotica]|uniref:Uncharacterized protein n=1 Tax=Vermiconidia calcicola TaxID=1690605 RepID=A0AAV9QLT4_9PEZI|nr:hypothetical protein H2202_004289 [Exophiala xenobiotica]KAK5528068.1 hypothetical protein LTR23_011139 [Chaetothyriales sp. CCFEE 6169]KAK5544207.1 hypothetical protein LTR25_001822 [Vermiconidia calcicola]KAK5191313.1 hypothetical protein LTR92_009032 [Exophiala xenobiotica]KAK5203490.1 hypothetical protein LTR41_010735 [Exophiala xenobiotica]